MLSEFLQKQIEEFILSKFNSIFKNLNAHSTLVKDQTDALRQRNNIETQKLLELKRQNTILNKICLKIPSTLDPFFSGLPEKLQLLCEKLDKIDVI